MAVHSVYLVDKDFSLTTDLQLWSPQAGVMHDSLQQSVWGLG